MIVQNLLQTDFMSRHKFAEVMWGMIPDGRNRRDHEPSLSFIGDGKHTEFNKVSTVSLKMSLCYRAKLQRNGMY